MITSEKTNHINRALFKLQGLMPNIGRDNYNTHFKSKYMTWDNIADVVIPLLQQCGILLEQEDGEIDGYKTVTTILTHVESGEFKRYAPFRIRELDSGNPDHNAGRSATYAKKQSLCLAIGIRGTDEDNDGNNPEFNKPKNKNTNDYSKHVDFEDANKAFYGISNTKQQNAKQTSTEHKPSRTVENIKKGRRELVILCKQNGIEDAERYAITEDVTGKRSCKELEYHELQQVYMYILKKVRAQKNTAQATG